MINQASSNTINVDQGVQSGLKPVLLISGTFAFFIAFSFLPRVTASTSLRRSVWIAGGILLAGTFAVLMKKASGYALCYLWRPRPVHYVQMVMHSSIYAYWGWYWHPVITYVPLLIMQILFAYGFDMFVCWTRRDKYILGFGMFPIILSTNLFLWFKDGWYGFQFLMIMCAIICKEYLTWCRKGNRTHIFNPSAIALFGASIVLLLTDSTKITWAGEIATSLAYPPHIYVELFALGLIVQALFSVTVITLSAALALYVLNHLFTAVTGTYYFVDVGISAPLFLALHLLVTDPATSPRSRAGRVVFGALYGSMAFGIYGVLGSLQLPQFYDKLLCVPVLNMSVRRLDGMGQRFDRYLDSLMPSPQKFNFACMALWSTLFGLMLSTNFLEVITPDRQ